MILESKSIYIEVDESGKFSIYDKIVDIEWDMGKEFLFGSILLENEERIDIDRFQLTGSPNSIVLNYANDEKGLSFRATLRLIPPGDTLDIIINAKSKKSIKHIEFLRDGFSVEEDMGGFYIVPMGSGRFLLKNTKTPSHVYSSKDFSMFMYGIVNDSSLLLSVWDDPDLDISFSRTNSMVSSTFITYKIPQRVQFKIISEGDIETLSESYRMYVARKGYIEPLEKKLENRNHIEDILKRVIFKIKDIEEEKILSFISHLKDDLRFLNAAILFEEDRYVDIEKAETALKDIEYPIISNQAGIRFLEIIDNLSNNAKTSKEDDTFVFSKTLKERLIPHIDTYYLENEIDFLDTSFFPLFEIVYGDTISLIEEVNDFSDIDKKLLTSFTLGRMPLIADKFIPQDEYWKSEEEDISLMINKYLSLFERPSIFMKGEGGWGEGVHPFDILLKNLEEIFVPFRHLTFGKRIKRFEYLDNKDMITYTDFGDIEVVVNFSNRHYEYFSTIHGRTFLPPYGFIISSDRFLSFYAYGINDYRAEKPLLVSVRTLDQEVFKSTKKLKVYHAFGPSEFRFMRKLIDVKDEKVYTIKR